MFVAKATWRIRTVAEPKRIDLTAILQAAFPKDLILDLARETGLVKRVRDFVPFVFFWALISAILAGTCKSIASVLKEYERLTGKKMDRASFYRKIDASMVEFLRRLFARACEQVFPEAPAMELLRRFTATLLQDSTVIKLRAILAERWPGAGMPAAAKLNVILCAGGGGANKVQITKGTRAEVKFTTINKALRGALLLFDLGYQSLKNFARIENHGAYFLTRLKDNLHPTIAKSNVNHRGASIDVAGQPLREVLEHLQRAMLDVMVEIPVTLKGQPGPIPLEGHVTHLREWRVVGLKNPMTGEYHLYLTNIPPEWLTAEQIGAVYAYRWEIERLFAELKGPYALGSWAVAREESMLVQTYAVLIAWAISRKLRATTLAGADAVDIHLAMLAAPLLRWALVLIHHARDLAKWVVTGRRAPRHLIPLLREQARDPNRGRMPLAARTKRVSRNARVTRLSA